MMLLFVVQRKAIWHRRPPGPQLGGVAFTVGGIVPLPGAPPPAAQLLHSGHADARGVLGAGPAAGRLGVGSMAS